MNNPNPYQAPDVNGSALATSKSRRSTVRRPLSVWITLIMLALSIILFSIGFGSAYYAMLAQPTIGKIAVSPADMVKPIAMGLLIAVPVLAIPVVAIWGIFRRAQLGRWMGLAALALLFAASALGQMIKTPEAARHEYANEAERTGALAGRILMAGLYLTLVYRFGFGSKARAYFAPRPDDEDGGESSQHW